MSRLSKVTHLTRTKEFVPINFLNPSIPENAKAIDIQILNTIRRYNSLSTFCESSYVINPEENPIKFLDKLYIFNEWLSREDFMSFYFRKTINDCFIPGHVKKGYNISSERVKFSFISGILVHKNSSQYNPEISAIMTLPEDVYSAFKGVEGFTVEDIASEIVIFASERFTKSYVTGLRKELKAYGGKPKSNVNVIPLEELYKMFTSEGLINDLGVKFYDSAFQLSVLEKLKERTPSIETELNLENVEIDEDPDDYEDGGDWETEDEDGYEEIYAIHNPQNLPLPPLEVVRDIQVVESIVRPSEPIRYRMSDGNWLFSSIVATPTNNDTIEEAYVIEAYQECLYPEHFGDWGWADSGYYVSIEQNIGPTNTETVSQPGQPDDNFVVYGGTDAINMFQRFMESIEISPDIIPYVQTNTTAD